MFRGVSDLNKKVGFSTSRDSKVLISPRAPEGCEKRELQFVFSFLPVLQKTEKRELQLIFSCLPMLQKAEKRELQLVFSCLPMLQKTEKRELQLVFSCLPMLQKTEKRELQLVFPLNLLPQEAPESGNSEASPIILLFPSGM